MGEVLILRRELEEYATTVYPDDRSQEFHPSNIDACGREIILTMKDNKRIIKPLPLHSMLTFDVGHYLHYMLQDYFIDMGLCPDGDDYESYKNKFINMMEYEFAGTNLLNGDRMDHLVKRFRWCMNKRVEIPVGLEDYNVVGHVDAVVLIDGQNIPVDIKTINSTRFAMQIAKKPVHKDSLQLLVYMYILAESKGIIIYLNKDDQGYRGPGFKEYLIKMIDWVEVVNEKLEWFKMLKHCADVGELPERPFTQNSKECNACDYKKICWSSENVGVLPSSPFE